MSLLDLGYSSYLDLLDSLIHSRVSCNCLLSYSCLNLFGDGIVLSVVIFFDSVQEVTVGYSDLVGLHCLSCQELKLLVELRRLRQLIDLKLD